MWGRSQQIGSQEGKGSEYQLSNHVHNPTLFSSLPHCCIAEFRGNHGHWLGLSSSPGLLWPGNLFSIDLLDSAFIRRMLVTGEKDVRLSSCSLPNLSDNLFAVLGCPWSRNDCEQKTTFRVNRSMVPNIAFVFIFRTVGVHCLFFLSDERPLFVELNLSGLRGKKKPAHHEDLEHVHRSSSHTESRCPCSPPAGGLWREFRNLPEGGPAKIERFFQRDATQKEGFLASPRSDNRMSCNESFESSPRFHSSRKTGDCPCSEVQIGYIPCSDSKRPRWDAEKSPLLPPLFKVSRNGTGKRRESTAKNCYFRTRPLFLPRRNGFISCFLVLL